VAIVGGGCAGLAAAWQITEFNRTRTTPVTAAAPAFEVTLYERSCRLGGKGGSWRDDGGRIREHGLHIWLGFYENAFKMIRDCYGQVQRADWGPNGNPSIRKPLPVESFEEAFFPEQHIGVAAPGRGGHWEAWTGLLPPMKGLPGDIIDENTNPFTLAGYLARCVGLSKALIHSIVAPPSGVSEDERRSPLDETVERELKFDPRRSPGVVLDSMTRLLRVGTLTTAAGLLQGVTIIETWLREHNPAPQFASSVLAFLEAVTTQVRRQLSDVVSIDEHVRQKTAIIDLIMTIVVGLYRDRVLLDPRGLDSINGVDCKAWLLQHGAMRESVASPFVTGLYDLAFCYRDGNRKDPALAAGQALRGALRMFFTYRGSLFWRMRSGMGDCVFAPLYRVLVDRGVHFNFCHELERVKYSPRLDKPEEARVLALQFALAGSRAAVKTFSAQPLDPAGCWKRDQTFKGARGTAEKRDERDFDVVIFAMGIEDFRAVCTRSADGTIPGNPDFFKCLPRWDDMQKHVKTVGTQAAQAWLDRSTQELGWMRGPGIVSALEPPFESWGDLSDTFASERAWRGAMKLGATNATRSIAYFVGVLSDKDIDARKGKRQRTSLEERVRDNLKQKLTEGMAPLWPAAFKSDGKGGTPGSLLKNLVCEDGAVSPDENENLKNQHVQANFKGSDRYTLALPGSLEHRISPLDLSVANMTIAGDWTECGFNEGCVEAAVMSGMLASHAICGFPALSDIVGYDHP
jgi:uncharacterized protein with NAD-binding domain and iron-sulfur cluster